MATVAREITADQYRDICRCGGQATASVGGLELTLQFARDRKWDTWETAQRYLLSNRNPTFATLVEEEEPSDAT
jgi:hypothetical protein